MHPIHFVSVVEGISLRQARENIYSLKVTETLHIDFESVRIALEEFTDVSMPFGYTNLLDTSVGYIGDMARNYLEARGIDMAFADTVGVGYCKDRPAKDSGIEDWYGYVVSPYVGDGVLKYYTGRNYLSSNFLAHKFPAKSVFKVGKSEVIFNEDAKYGQMCIAVESIMCCLTLGPTSMAFGGKDPSSTQMRKLLSAPYDCIAICLDAGTKLESARIAMQLLNYRDDIKIKVCDLGYYEARGLGKDPNEIGKNEIFYHIKHQQLITCNLKELVKYYHHDKHNQ
jgi:hypothetical protein